MNSRIRSLRAGRTPQPVARRSIAEALTRRLGTWVGTDRRRALRARERLEQLDPDQRLREVGEW
ncbi:short-chain dehydrogenase [Variovorax sp. J22P271]|uniref:short-chain dehydrogenase n=1 Tax=Variovorax davisae TaxID=3053515 RepID=UPI002576D362|nr:short-chain dehydrogenase [Variovorax sp. J22P271]MDM0032904.1 short-chain dehydrogenase [Variovorax sp. J22P271]